VLWDKVGEHKEHDPSTAKIYCKKCKQGWQEGERQRALSIIRWHETKPFSCCDMRISPLKLYESGECSLEKLWQWVENECTAVFYALCPTCGRRGVDNHHAGFTASKLFSPWSKDRPADIAKKWLLAKDNDATKQAWFNTQLGQPFRAQTRKTSTIDQLLARCETWEEDLPQVGGVLTAGVDVQDERIEIELVFWGKNEESWSIDYSILPGNFDDLETQKRLDEYLRRTV